MFISIGYVIIDDIVLPDGTTHMGCLGGGSVHAIMGMRVWSDQVGLVAKVGVDFPANLEKELNSIFDMRGVSILNKKTMRAWQNFDADGTRTETFRSDPADFPLYKPLLEEFPAVYDSLQGVHLHCSCNEVVGWIERLRPLGNPFILWEPLQAEGLAEFRPGFFKVLPLVDCVSPNLQEASALLQLNDPHDLLDAMIDKGAKQVVIRAGAQGSVYADSSGEYIQVPAVRVDQIIDQTGAGNAYCGGLVVGSVLSQDPCDALCRAAVSASFALEQFGALFPMEALKEKADSRLRICREELNNMN